MAGRGMRFMYEGMKRFRPLKDCLTPLHADYLALSLKSLSFKQSIELLNETIYDIDISNTGMTPRDLLLYYYYGGMIYTAMKQFKKAHIFFENALCVPAFALNAIMVESFKKFVLLSLLAHGRNVGLPKNAANIVHRHMKVYCQAYLDFSSAHDSHDVDKLVAVSIQFKEVFTKDRNFGLIKQCIESLKKGNIERLTETYLTLSLVDITKAANLSSIQDSEKILLQMIENKQINAVVNQKNKMVSFNEEKEEFESPETYQNLDERIANSISLCDRLKRIDNDLGSSTLYIARSSGLREDFEFGKGKGSGGGMMGGFGRMMGMFGQ